MKSKQYHIGILALMLALACNKKESVSGNDQSYAPVAAGQERVYRIHLVKHNGFNKNSDTSDFFQREYVEGYFYDNEGDSSYRIGIYKSESTAGPWEFVRYEYVSHTSGSFELVRDNMRRVKLLYPVKNLKLWDENEFNVLPQAQNRYRDIAALRVIDGKAYGNTLLVDGDSINDPILLAYRKSIYAINIGLVYEDDIYRQTQNEKYEGQEIRKILVDRNF